MTKTNIFRKIGALCAAMGVYWLIVSAALRHVNLSAAELSPLFGGGSFHPARLVLFVLLLAAAIFLAFTGAGRAIGEYTGSLCLKGRWRVLFAVLTTALLFVWILRVSVIQFMTNDDPFIMKVIASIPESGLSAAASTFSHVVFCAILAFFYRIAPNGYWYTWYHLAALFVSMAVLCRCFLAKASAKGHALPGYLLFVLLVLGVFSRTAAALSFTVTPAVVGCAAIALILCLDVTDSRAGRIVSAVLSVVLMMLCYLQRTDSGKCILCFWALAVCWYIFRAIFPRRPKLWRRLACLILCVVLTLGGILACSDVGSKEEYTADTEYQVAEYYRSLVLDFMLPSLTDEQVEAVGLSPELTALLRCWYLMDEQLTTETFMQLAAQYSATPALDEATVSSLGSLVKEISADRAQLLIALTLLCLLLGSVAMLILQGRSYLPEFLCALFAVGGALIMMLYLTMQGRFLLRTFLLIALPAVTICAFMLFSAPEAKEPAKGSRHVSGRSVLALALAGLAVCGIWNTSTIPYAAQAVSGADVNLQQDALEEYLFAHPDTLFISSMYEANLKAFHTADYPTNSTLWGACGTTADPDRLYSDAFFKDGNRFIADDMRMILYLMHYLTLSYGPVQLVVEERLDGGTMICRVEQVTPGDDYTGWYEQNDMTYYFENGTPVSGSYTIDGTEYSFTEPGYAGGYGFVYIQDADIYTTAAYSLITA